MNLNKLQYLLKTNVRHIYTVLYIIYIGLTNPISVTAFPLYAQQGYEDPREATGRIVCANCHLAQQRVEIETPQAVLPNSIFETKVRIPYDNNRQQLLGNGQKGSMNMGAVLILPEGFKLAPNNLMNQELKEKTKGTYIQPYSTTRENILVVGPIPGNKNKEIIFPVLSPDPSNNKNIHFLKYPIYVGGNRGRGQIYPTGDKSNNNAIIASHTGKIKTIELLDKGGYNITIENTDGLTSNELIPVGFNLRISEGDNISINQAITNDPNIGGFGQNETEIVLQNPIRIQWMIAFFFTVTLAQIFFVLKKKQWEKVQSAEINF